MEAPKKNKPPREPMTEQQKAEKQREYVRRYLNKFSDVKVRISAETKEQWRTAAEARGKSLQRFVIDAVEAEIERLKKGG